MTPVPHRYRLRSTSGAQWQPEPGPPALAPSSALRLWRRPAAGRTLHGRTTPPAADPAEQPTTPALPSRSPGLTMPARPTLARGSGGDQLHESLNAQLDPSVMRARPRDAAPPRRTHGSLRSPTQLPAAIGRPETPLGRPIHFPLCGPQRPVPSPVRPRQTHTVGKDWRPRATPCQRTDAEKTAGQRRGCHSWRAPPSPCI